MASKASDILESLLGSLRTAGAFSRVVLGPSGQEADVPRLHVLYEGLDWLQADDSADVRWGRLRATACVRTRSTDVIEGVARASDLCDAAVAALLSDPYRGGRCEDLPAGRATEIGRCQLSQSVKRPEIEMTFDIRCHFETREAE